jgi:hypothetical protein
MAQDGSNGNALPPGAGSTGAALADAITAALRKGFSIESQSESEARLIRPGRKRWFGLFGGRVPETRKIVRVDEHGRATVEPLPVRRY